MGKIRFLYNNLLDGAGVGITPSSHAAAIVTGAQKVGAGSGMCYPGGVYTDSVDRLYVLEIDGAGDVGTATFRWSDDGGISWPGTGVLTSAAAIALSHGVTIRQATGVGTDFLVGDRFTWKAVAIYGPARLLDRNRNTEWRSAGVSAPVTLTIDLVTAQAFQALVLHDHNLTAAATLTLAANSSDSWGAPAYGPVAIPWAAGTIGYYLAAAQTYRYVQVTISDPTNPDGYLRASNLFLGPYTELSSNFDRGWSRGRSPYLDGDLTSLHPAAIPTGLPEVLTVPFTLLPSADRATLIDTIYAAVYATAARRVRPLWVNPDSATPNDQLLGIWEGDALPTSPYLDRWTGKVTFRELVRVIG